MCNRIFALLAVICIFSPSHTMQQERKGGVLQQIKHEEAQLQQRLLQRAVHRIETGGIVNGQRYTVYYANQTIGHCTHIPHERHLKDKYIYREERHDGQVFEISGAVARELFLHYRILHDGSAEI